MHRRKMPWLVAGCVLLGVIATAQTKPSPRYVPLADVRQLLVTLASSAPRDLPATTGAGADARWLTWVAKHDQAIRDRLKEGDEDTLLNWLLLGGTFTTLPPARFNDAIGSETAANQATALIRSRVDAFVLALATPGADERRRFARGFLEGLGFRVTTPADRVRTRDYLLRALQRMFGAAAPQTTAGAGGAASSAPTSQFERRGLSLDTTLQPNFALEGSLRALSDRRILAAGSVRRVAIIGAGLDFADKNTGFDFYPVQTVQPFALLDTLRRLRLTPATGSVEVVALDVSPRVIGHIASAHAAAASGYVVHLPLSRTEPWSLALRRYWSAFGDQIGTPAASTSPAGVEMRTLRFPPAVVSTLTAEDVNVIVARSRLPQFDLVIATNVLLYYGAFDQALALSNIEAMLNSGGLFLTNTALQPVPASRLRRVGSKVTLYTTDGRGDEVSWYQRVDAPSAGRN